MTLEEIRQPILHELEEVESEFQKLLKSDVSLIENIIAHITTYKGKRLRPILLLLCSGLKGKITTNSIKAATLIELLHTATLIHDDVVDKSELRRGGATVNSIWTNKISILIGDYIFSAVLYGLSRINNLEMIHVMSDVARRMSQGELLQLEYGKNFQMDEATYFRLISDKTASLLDATCVLGAITSAANDREHVQNLKKFGDFLGKAFQIKDDVLDLIGQEEKMGKPTSKDLVENTITLPLLYGLKNSNNHYHDKILTILKRGIQAQDVTIIRQFARDTGGIEYATRKAQFFTDSALQCLTAYDDSAYKQALIHLTTYITARER